jgi:hypothetical protein
VHLHGREVVVVESCAAKFGVGEIEAERTDEVQLASGGGHHADRVPCVGRYAGLDERNAEHGALERDAEQRVDDRAHQPRRVGIATQVARRHRSGRP